LQPERGSTADCRQPNSIQEECQATPHDETYKQTHQQCDSTSYFAESAGIEDDRPNLLFTAQRRKYEQWADEEYTEW
jgi:hypothetical protein